MVIKNWETAVRNVRNKPRGSGFFKNVLLVMAGTVAAQAVGFGLTPIVSRLYSPIEFGVFASFSAVLGVVSAAATMQYTQALMLPKDKGDAFSLLLVSCACTFAMALVALGAWLVAPSALQSLTKTRGTLEATLLIVAILVIGISQSCQAWAVREKAFNRTSAAQVIRSLSSNGSKIGFGFLNVGAVGLIAATVLSDVLVSISFIPVFFRDVRKYWDGIRIKRILELAKDYRDFPMYSASQNVMNALSSGLPVILLSRFYGTAVAGAYAFAEGILLTPMSLVLVALRQVLFQRAAETQREGGRLSSLYVRTTAGLLVLVLLPSVVVLTWAPDIFSFVFGSQWRLAGVLARSLMIWMAFVFCNLPAVLLAPIIRIQRFVFLYDLSLLLGRLLALLFGGFYLNASQTVLLFALVGASMNAFLIVRVGRVVLTKEKMSLSRALGAIFSRG